MAQDDSNIAAAHQAALDMAEWIGCIPDRLEAVLFQSATKEIQHAVLANLLGQYRLAMTGIRSYLELSLGACHLSGNEKHLRLWLVDSADLKWSELNDDTDGVFGTNFLAAFFPELVHSSKDFRKSAGQVYRECSQFVHSNKSASDALPDQLEYEGEAASKFYSTLNQAHSVVILAIIARYGKDLKSAALTTMEHIIIDKHGTIQAVQQLYANSKS